MTDADCTTRGRDFANTVCVDQVCQAKPDPAWSCVGHVPPPSSSAMYAGQYKLIDVITQAPVTDATVRLCNKLDPACAAPLQTLTLAADGTTSVTVLANFNGYLEIISKNYVPTLYFIDTTVSAPVSNVSLLTPAVQGALNSTVGVMTDPAKGGLSISVSDCTGARAAGVQLDIAPKSSETRYYAIASAISTTATATDTTGNGGFINVAPGSATVTGMLEKSGELLGQVTTLSRAGTITFQRLPPTPLP